MPVPIVTVAQMRRWEQATWAAGQTESAVIECVGGIVAQRALALTQAGDSILILAGKGHNGDDARAARPHLVAREAQLLNVTSPETGLRELQRSAARPPKLIIDGLFGIGLNRPLSAEWKKMLDEINRAGAPVLSIDVPSGLDADSGEPQGAAIHASITVALGAPKPGLLLTGAAQFVGRLEVAPDIGLVPCPHQNELQWTLAQDFEGYPPTRPVNAHKGTFGHLAIFSGSLGYHGAAVLAARGALSARPGLVTLFTQEKVYLPVAAQLQAAMVQPWHPGARLPDSCSALLIGPGLAAPDLPADLKSESRHLWQELPLPVVVDASALDWLPSGATRSGVPRVITPHPGEAARLLEVSVSDVQAGRPRALRHLSRRYGDCWVVLKGNHTLVGRSTGDIFVNPTGNPGLAQGGSGDVLAGLTGGLMAQRPLQSDPGRTIRYAVWRHGRAADVLNEAGRNWTVETLLDALTG